MAPVVTGDSAGADSSRNNVDGTIDVQAAILKNTDYTHRTMGYQAKSARDEYNDDSGGQYPAHDYECAEDLL
jgi:hypothetical protein